MQNASIYREGLFHGRTALVAGGGSGIGSRAALELASLGCAVFLLGRTGAKLASVAQEIEAAGGAAAWAACDIRNEAELDAALDKLTRTYGRLDYMVNSAGGQFPAPLLEISKSGFDAVVSTN